MTVPTHNIKIQHETFGTLLSETFVNAGQFKLFLKMVQGCLALKEDLTFFNGTDFLVHIPYNHLKNSVITTIVDNYSLSEHLVNKSKMEAEKIK
jgi:competence transcription factor ComK